MKKPHSFAVSLFVAVSAVGLYLIYLNEQVRGNQFIESAPQILSSRAYEIEHIFSDLISITHVVEKDALKNPFRQSEFEDFANPILAKYPFIASLQLLPNSGVVTNIQQNEVDEISHIEIAQNLTQITSSTNTTPASVVNPFTGSNGETYFIAKNPIDDIDYSTSWGYITAIVRLKDLLEALDTNTITQQGYYVELMSGDPNTGPSTSLYTNGLKIPADADQLKIGGVNADLYLRLGCTSNIYWTGRVIGLTLTLAFALMAGLLGYRICREPELLRKKVVNQTKDLHTLAYRDCLTKLPNRKAFYSELSKLTASPIAENNVGLLLFDLDNFSLINDTMGHPTGDLLIKAIAIRIATVIPKSFYMARLGGDEFTLILTGSNLEKKLKLMSERVNLCFKTPFAIKGNEIYMTASIGYATLNRGLHTADQLLAAADQALLHAKQNDNHITAHFTDDMLQAAKRKQRLTYDLRDAINRQQLELYYQPIFCTAQKALRKCEALLRWHHPQLGPISPMEFIPLAEQNGLITEIGEWVFAETAMQLALWRDLTPVNFQISINVSPVQFNTHDLASNWCTLLKQKNLDSSAILIEITESVFLKNSTHTQQQLTALHSAGFEIALDDFGTGYSSLSYLNNFNIDYVKIDRAFIKNIIENDNDKIVCKGIISIARNLGIRVVAEGIETTEQHALMSKEGCHYCQGYLFSKPLPAAEFEAFFLQYVQSAKENKTPDYILDETINAA